MPYFVLPEEGFFLDASEKIEKSITRFKEGPHVPFGGRTVFLVSRSSVAAATRNSAFNERL